MTKGEAEQSDDERFVMQHIGRNITINDDGTITGYVRGRGVAVSGRTATELRGKIESVLGLEAAVHKLEERT